MRDLDALVKQYHELDKKLEISVTRLDSIADSLDSINNTLSENTRQLDQNTLQLEIHIRGVQALEKANVMFREELDLFKGRLIEAEQPKVVAKGIMWVVGSLSALGGLFLLFREILKG